MQKRLSGENYLISLLWTFCLFAIWHSKAFAWKVQTLMYFAKNNEISFEDEWWRLNQNYNIDFDNKYERLFLGVLKEDLFYFFLKNNFSEIFTFAILLLCTLFNWVCTTLWACPMQLCLAILLVNLASSFLYAFNLNCCAKVLHLITRPC